jgi:hypothetical protein
MLKYKWPPFLKLCISLGLVLHIALQLLLVGYVNTLSKFYKCACLNKYLITFHCKHIDIPFNPYIRFNLFVHFDLRWLVGYFRLSVLSVIPAASILSVGSSSSPFNPCWRLWNLCFNSPLQDIPCMHFPND